VPWADSALVSGRLEGLARAATISGDVSSMTSNPDLVSRAIFEWWWITKGNRGRYARRVRAHGRGGPPVLSMDDSDMGHAGHVAAIPVSGSGPFFCQI
jgi:hypothetical protein